MKYFVIYFGIILLQLSCHKNNGNFTLIRNDTTKAIEKDTVIKYIPGVIFNGNREYKKIALTFDADLTESMLNKSASLYNYEIENILRKNNIKATIFITGLWAEYYEKQLKELANDTLFEIGNHSYSHKSFTHDCFNLKKLGDKHKKEDVLKAQEIIKRITGKYPLLFRFPGGCYSVQDVELVNELGLNIIQWDVISGDAIWKNPDKIIRNVLNKIQNGSIVIMHFTGNKKTPATAESLQKIIDELKKRGFEFVKVSELIM